MEKGILKLLAEYNELELISGPNYRIGRHPVDETGTPLKNAGEYYDCTLEYKGKIFPVTFVPSENLKQTLLEYLKRYKIPL